MIFVLDQRGAMRQRSSWRCYERNQLPATPNQKGKDQNDKEARGEQLATGMGGWRKVKVIVHVGPISGMRVAN